MCVCVYMKECSLICIQCAARAKPPPCQTCGWKLEKKLKQDDENMLENGFENGAEIGVKSLTIRAPGELLGDPPGAKMAQDAIWDASGAPFGDLLGRILAPRWRQVGQLGAKMCPRWPTWGARLPTWRTFWSILATFVGSWARSCQKW